MKLLIISSILLAACGVSTPIAVNEAAVTGAIPAKPVRPPSWCSDGGGCPLGMVCGDEGVCGVDCGSNFMCPIGWYCYLDGPRHQNHDCLPAGSCVYADGGC